MYIPSISDDPISIKLHPIPEKFTFFLNLKKPSFDTFKIALKKKIRNLICVIKIQRMSQA